MVPNHNKRTLYCKIKTLQSRENASNQMAVWTKKLPFNRKKRERQEGAAIYHNYLEAFVYFFSFYLIQNPTWTTSVHTTAFRPPCNKRHKTRKISVKKVRKLYLWTECITWKYVTVFCSRTFSESTSDGNNGVTNDVTFFSNKYINKGGTGQWTGEGKVPEITNN